MFSDSQDIMVFAGLAAAGVALYLLINWYCIRELKSKRWIWDNFGTIKKQLAAFNIHIQMEQHTGDWCKLIMPRCDKATKALSFHTTEKILRMMEVERPDHVFYRYAKDVEIIRQTSSDKPLPKIGASHHGKD